MFNIPANYIKIAFAFYSVVVLTLSVYNFNGVMEELDTAVRTYNDESVKTTEIDFDYSSDNTFYQNYENMEVSLGLIKPSKAYAKEPEANAFMASFYSQETDIECERDLDCNFGTCQFANENDTTGHCFCSDGYLSLDKDGNPSDIPCMYEQKEWGFIVMMIIFLGYLGIDYCCASQGNGGFICFGILKGLTCGGCGIWQIIVFALALSGGWEDGNGVPFYNKEWLSTGVAIALFIIMFIIMCMSNAFSIYIKSKNS